MQPYEMTATVKGMLKHIGVKCSTVIMKDIGFPYCSVHVDGKYFADWSHVTYAFVERRKGYHVLELDVTEANLAELASHYMDLPEMNLMAFGVRCTRPTCELIWNPENLRIVITVCFGAPFLIIMDNGAVAVHALDTQQLREARMIEDGESGQNEGGEKKWKSSSKASRKR